VLDQKVESRGVVVVSTSCQLPSVWAIFVVLH